MRVERVPFRLISAATAAVFLAACGPKQSAPPQQTPEVGVVTVQPSAVPVTSELPGRTSAYLVAEVRARVDGIVLRREFTEGSEVKAGQRLYKIDPAPYIATLNNAKAALAKAQANLASTSAQAARYKVLVAANAVSKQDYDNAVAAEGQAAADVAAGKAAVDTAQINLGYTDVTSPITGRIGKSSVTEGALATADQSTALATVQDLSKIYVDLTESAGDVMRLEQAFSQGGVGKPASAQVTLVLEDGTIYPIQGRLQFSDVTVDEGTGTVGLRALFPNPDGVLLPGLFVRARLIKGVAMNGILVPQQAVSRDARGQGSVFVVGANGAAEVRQIALGPTEGDKWLVADGLKPGDQVIVEGLQKVRPGAPVKPTTIGARP